MDSSGNFFYRFMNFKDGIFRPQCHTTGQVLCVKMCEYIERMLETLASFKDTLWVLRHDEPLVHVSVDISLITEHILDHDILLKS